MNGLKFTSTNVQIISMALLYRSSVSMNFFFSRKKYGGLPAALPTNCRKIDSNCASISSKETRTLKTCHPTAKVTMGVKFINSVHEAPWSTSLSGPLNLNYLYSIQHQLVVVIDQETYLSIQPSFVQDDQRYYRTSPSFDIANRFAIHFEKLIGLWLLPAQKWQE